MILEKHQLLQRTVFLWQMWRSSLAVSGSRNTSSQVPCCKCISVTSGLVWPLRAGRCPCMQTSAWHPRWEFWNHLCHRSAGSSCLHLRGLRCRGRCCWPVNTSLLPRITAVLGGSSKADYKVLQHSQIMYRVSHTTVWCLSPKASVWTCSCGQKQASAWGFCRLQALRPSVQNWTPCKEEMHGLAKFGRAPAVHFLILPSCNMPIWIFLFFFQMGGGDGEDWESPFSARFQSI